MSTPVHRETAKIYAFPVKLDAARRRRMMHAQMMADIAAQNLPATDFGSGWYHDAAIEEDGKEFRH